MKKYEVELSFRFADGAERIIGECDTIEEAKEICEKHAKETLKSKEEIKDLGGKENQEITHVFAIPGVRYFVKTKKTVSKP